MVGARDLAPQLAAERRLVRRVHEQRALRERRLWTLEGSVRDERVTRPQCEQPPGRCLDARVSRVEDRSHLGSGDRGLERGEDLVGDLNASRVRLG